ncbi:hypothetical protein S83_030186 [Arachis hypogaea]
MVIIFFSLFVEVNIISHPCLCGCCLLNLRVEEQQKKALEEDPTVFDYDGVYDKMKEKVARPLIQDREQRKSRYIQNLIKKVKEREQYHDIVYEKKIAKERSKYKHLYDDKDKFITEAYRKKLAERDRWS